MEEIGRENIHLRDESFPLVGRAVSHEEFARLLAANPKNAALSAPEVPSRQEQPEETAEPIVGEVIEEPSPFVAQVMADAERLSAEDEPYHREPITYAIVPIMAQVEYPADGSSTDMILPDGVTLLDFYGEPATDADALLHNSYGKTILKLWMNCWPTRKMQKSKSNSLPASAKFCIAKNVSRNVPRGKKKSNH